MSKAALIKPETLRGFFVVVYSEVGAWGIEYVASLPACSSVCEQEASGVLLSAILLAKKQGGEREEEGEGKLGQHKLTIVNKIFWCSHAD